MKMLRLLGVAMLLGLGGLALGPLAERWLIYPLDATRVAPSDLGLTGLHEIEIESGGETLVVWVAKPAPGKPVILYFHGNAGNLAARAGRFRRILARGYGLIAPAYRGSSGSTGSPVEQELRGDAGLIYLKLSEIIAGLRPDQVVIYGESIGGAVALALLASPQMHPMKGPGKPAAVVLEDPFTSIAALAELHYPALAGYADRLSNQWDNLSAAGAVDIPLLVLHGSDDALIPTEQGRQVFTAAPSLNKEFLLVPGAGHTDLWRSDTRAKLWRFVETYLFK